MSEGDLRRALRTVRFAYAFLLEDLAELSGISSMRLLWFETGQRVDFTPEEAMNLHGVLTALMPSPGQRWPPPVA